MDTEAHEFVGTGRIARRSLLTHGATLLGGAAGAVVLAQSGAAGSPPAAAAAAPLPTIVVTTRTGAAVQAAINGLPATGGIVQLVAGTYAITKSLLVRSACQVVGSGRGVTVLRLTNGANTAVLRNADTAAGNTKVAIRGLSVDGNRANQSKSLNHHGIELHKCADLLLDDLELAQADGTGLVVSGDGVVTRVGRISNVYSHDNSLQGINVNWAMREITYVGVTCDLNGQDGLVIDHSESIAMGLHCSRNGRDGIRITNVVLDQVTGVKADLNGRTGIRVMGFVQSVGTSWAAHNNGQKEAASDIHFDATLSTYGPTDQSTVNGIECGVLLKSTWGAPYTSKTTETYGLAVDPAVVGNLTLNGVRNTGGKTGVYDLAPVGSTGALAIIDHAAGTGEFRLLRGNLHIGGGDLVHDANGKLGFYGANATSRPTVTGTKDADDDGSVAMSILAALTSLGLVIDGTS